MGETLEAAQQRLLDRRHQLAVEGIGETELADANLVAPGDGGELVDRLDVAATVNARGEL